MAGEAVPWQKCGGCGDYVCFVHDGEHVADCACPGIETWIEWGLWPYGPCDPDEVDLMLIGEGLVAPAVKLNGSSRMENRA